MKWFANLATRTKLLAGFSLMLFLLAIISVTAYLCITATQESQARIVHDNFKQVIVFLELRSEQNRLRSKALEMTLSTNKEQQEALEQEIRGGRENLGRCSEPHRGIRGDHPARDLPHNQRNFAAYIRNPGPTARCACSFPHQKVYIATAPKLAGG